MQNCKDKKQILEILAAEVNSISCLCRENKNVSIVHVFFNQDAVYPKVRKVLFETSDLIGNKQIGF